MMHVNVDFLEIIWAAKQEVLSPDSSVQFIE